MNVAAIPFVASGGIGNAQQLVAALALGAEGINMGTRFIATTEAPVHQNVKDAILAASELDTTLIMRGLRNTERVIKNPAVDKIVAIERDKGNDLAIEDIIAPRETRPYLCQFFDAMQHNLKLGLGPKQKGGVRP